MIPRLDWGVFIEAATQFPDADMKNMLPNDAPEGDDVEEEVLRAIHRALLEWHVVSGTLTAEGGGVYQVTNGIPNLVITEVRAKEGGEEEVVGNGEGEGEQEREQGAGGMEVEEQSAA